MRIIAGIHRNRKLEAPPEGDTSIRPTLDRSREALFNLLVHGPFADSPLRDAQVADICCGTGAIGLEALSRGAAHATFIDQSQAALNLTRRNAQTLREEPRCTLIRADAKKLPAAKQPCDVVLMDPPYDAKLNAAIVTSLAAQGWLREGSVLALEQRSFDPLPVLAHTELLRDREYGKTRILLYRWLDNA